MAKQVQLVHKETGLTAQAFRGFSWTTLFFGPFPALFRGDFLAFLIYLLIVIALAVVMGPLAILAMVALGLCWAFMYNDYHLRNLVSRGYVFADAAKKDHAVAPPPVATVAAPREPERPAPVVADLSSDAYKIFLVRKYKIERNDALAKVIVGDRLFDDIEAALRFADEQERVQDQEVEGLVWRLGKRIGWVDSAKSMFYLIDQVEIDGRAARPKPGARGHEIYRGDVDAAIRRAEFDAQYR